MKKNLMTLAFGFAFALALTSCNKETTCACTTSSNVPGIEDITVSTTVEGNVNCSDSDSSSSVPDGLGGTITTTVTCVEE